LLGERLEEKLRVYQDTRNGKKRGICKANALNGKRGWRGQKRTEGHRRWRQLERRFDELTFQQRDTKVIRQRWKLKRLRKKKWNGNLESQIGRGKKRQCGTVIGGEGKKEQVYRRGLKS